MMELPREFSRWSHVIIGFTGLLAFWFPVFARTSLCPIADRLRYRPADAALIASKKAWFYEHLTATLAAGIAFHTAFAVFGAARLFTLPSSGLLSTLPWILPAGLGIPATVLWKRFYQSKFGDRPGRQAESVQNPLASAP